MSSRSMTRIAAISFVSLILGSFLVLNILAANDAVSTVESAENVVALSYSATLEAEEAGADVSALLEQLNVATEYLALAKMSERRGDIDSAAGNASLCIETAEGIIWDAEALRDAAILERGEYSQRMIFVSVAGGAAVFLISFISWKVFKERYYRRLLKMKPEAVEGEA